MIGSVIVGAAETGFARSFERRSDSLIEASNDLSRAMYLLAFASDALVPPLRTSVYVYRGDLDTDPQLRREAELGVLAAEQTIKHREQTIAQLEQAITDFDVRKGEIEERLREAAERFKSEMADYEQRLRDLATHFEAQLSHRDQQLREAEERALAGRGREAHALAVIEALQRNEEVLTANIARLEHDLAELGATNTYLIQRGEALEQHVYDARGKTEAAERLNREANQWVAQLQQSYDRMCRKADQLSARLERIENSSIWRASYPVRRIGSRFPRVSRSLRLTAKVAWWTLTLQLPQRVRLWQARRTGRNLEPPAPVVSVPLPGTAGASPAAADAAPAPAVEAIRIPHAAEPVVSVIISTYGQLQVTLACLRSIASHAPSAPIEVIVVDDAYPGPDDMGSLRAIPGIILLRNATNLGFLLSCNQAARTAKGKYIYFLNNDTELREGSIDRLVELLDSRPDVGLAGSKLLFPDGTLQEAGGILWNDATGWNYGRGENPNRPDFNYVREVDYCSGASLMVRRELFDSLGGFDKDFVPAYYEDADLAFRIRERGFKVFYEPRSEVIHLEGTSHGTDVSSGIKAHQLVNQQRMLTRWGETLAAENYASGQHVMRARDRAKARTVMLVLEHYALEPDRDAGSRSTLGILDSLLAAGWVVKFWPLNRVYSPTYTVAMEQRGIEVIDQRWTGDFETWMRQNGDELDHVLVIRPDTAAMTLPTLMVHTKAVLSYYGVDLHFARVRRQALLEGDEGRVREAEMLERLERRVWRNFDLVIYPSEAEAETVREMAPGAVVRAIIPFCFQTSPARTAPVATRRLLFVAGFAHAPNVDAAIFLIKKIIPALEALVGPVSVTLAGSNPTEQVRQLAGKDVTVTGYVTEQELAGLYETHRAAVVPLRFGAGVKGKVIEALSRGLPVVITSVGAQGIDGVADVVPVHDEAEDIARELARLLTDDDAWIRQSHAQTAFASENFSPAAMQRSVLKAYET
jgi:GT2 family glycosyltransferase/glycosyltransferase involved in cell wall biosynthesis